MVISYIQNSRRNLKGKEVADLSAAPSIRDNRTTLDDLLPTVGFGGQNYGRQEPTATNKSQ